MQHLTRQLERLRATARWLLALRCAARWTAGTLTAAMALAVLDYALPLPGSLRLLLIAPLALLAVVALARQGMLAMRFNPPLAALALRAERLRPDWRGHLAVGVDLAADPDASPLAALAIERSRTAIDPSALRGLLHPAPTLRAAALAAGIALVAVSLAMLMPALTAIAVQRWLTPWRDTPWPRRVALVSLVDQTVAPLEAPAPLTVRMDRGHRPGLRAWVVCRREGQPEWRRLLLNVQSSTTPDAPVYARLIDLAADLPAPSPVMSDDLEQRLEFYFEAGDDRTAPQSLLLVRRPAVIAARLHVEPPEYARSVLPARDLELDLQQESVTSASALAGSSITLDLTFNKPLPVARLHGALPGLPPDAGAPHDGPSMVTALQRRFRLAHSAQTTVELEDEHGIPSLSDRVYRIEAAVDGPPAAAIHEPAGDEAVLPSAIVPLRAAARDDVGLAHLELRHRLQIADPRRYSEAAHSIAATQPAAREATIEQELDLARMSLQPGDAVTIEAVAQDVYGAADAGAPARPTVSAPRVLRLIDAATLAGQLRNELGALRQQAMRLDERQRQTVEARVDSAVSEQAQLTQDIAAGGELAARVARRMERNRLKEPSLAALTERARRLLGQASEASEQARELLEQAGRSSATDDRDKARQRQLAVSSALSELAAALDQGRDALTLELLLRELQARLDALAADTRAALPRTLGRSPEQLDAREAKDIAELAQRQRALAQSATSLAQQMQATAEQLASSPDAADQATAGALTEAAATARREGLAERLRDAGTAVERNQMSAATAEQDRAAEVVRQMLNQVRQQEQRRLTMLRRLADELEDALARLAAQQQALVDTTALAPAASVMEEPQTALRRNTLAVALQAGTAPATAAAGEEVQRAAEAQGRAVLALRGNERDEAQRAQRSALAHLEAALEKVRAIRREAEKREREDARDQLRQKYLALAVKQEHGREQTAASAAEGAGTRRHRAAMMAAAEAQNGVRREAAELGATADSTVVFRHAHERIETACAEAVSELRSWRAGPAVLDRQREVAALLRLMASALEPASSSSKFAGGAGEGGGGGGGGAGGPGGAVIPPASELRLLRGVMESLSERTRGLSDGAMDDAARRREVVELGARQRELAGLAERMAEEMRRGEQSRPRAPGGEP